MPLCVSYLGLGLALRFQVLGILLTYIEKVVRPSASLSVRTTRMTALRGLHISVDQE